MPTSSSFFDVFDGRQDERKDIIQWGNNRGVKTKKKNLKKVTASQPSQDHDVPRIYSRKEPESGASGFVLGQFDDALLARIPLLEPHGPLLICFLRVAAARYCCT